MQERMERTIDYEELIDYAKKEGYRKLLAMALWELPGLEKNNYDSLGKGAHGIAAYLRNIGYEPVFESYRVVVDEEARLYPYLDSVYLIEDLVSQYKYVWRGVKEAGLIDLGDLARIVPVVSLPFVHDLNRTHDKSKIETYIYMLNHIIDNLEMLPPRMIYKVVGKLEPYLEDYMRKMGNYDNPDKVFIEKYLPSIVAEIDAAAKEALVKYSEEKSKGNLSDAMDYKTLARVYTLIEAGIGLPYFDKEKFTKFINMVYDVTGSALQIAHMAALTTLLSGKVAYDMDELNDIINMLKEKFGLADDSIIVGVLRDLARGFFETADKLYEADAIVYDDWKSMHIAIEPKDGQLVIYVKTGGAGGHYANVIVHGMNKLEVHYSDHNSRRVESLLKFLRKLDGVEIIEERPTHIKFMWMRTPEELGMLLGSLASVDLKEHYEELESADTVEEIIENRIYAA